MAKAKRDPVVEKVVSRLRERSRVGQRKYGTTLDRPDFSELDWLKYLIEELLDATNYAQRLIMDMEARERRQRIKLDRSWVRGKR